MLMEIRQLRYFLSAARLGSIGAAAAEHFITQPAVSLQLKKLEGELGQKLLVRRGRRLVPTDAGTALIARAEDVIRALESLESEMHGFRELDSGTLRVGNTDAASVYVLPEVYREFHRTYPGVQIEITVGDTRRLLDALAARRIEVATATLPIDETGIRVRPIYRDELVPVVNADHPLAKRRRVTLRDLLSHEFITYPSGSRTRAVIDAVFALHGDAPSVRMEISSPEAMRVLTQVGLGVSVLPRALVAGEIERGALREISIAGTVFEREIGIVHRADGGLSPAARVFVDLVERRFPRVPAQKNR